MIISIALAVFFVVSFGLFEILGNFWGLVATAVAWIALVLIYAQPGRDKSRRVTQ